MERPTVLLAAPDDAIAYADALQRAGFEVLIDTSEVASGARAADLAVLDCDAGGVGELHAALHGRDGTAELLLLGDDLPPFLADGAAAGDELAMKPLAADALIFRLQALLIRSGRPLPAESSHWASESVATASEDSIGEGHVLSVFAPKGGVGKTTIAVNLAVALREQTRSSVLLFDADVGVGNVTAILDVKVRMGLIDLADSPESEWTDAAFDQTVSVHEPSGVRVLTWGHDPADSERVTVDLLIAALRWARRHHSWVVVDNHPGYSDRTMAMLSVANEIMLVVTPEMGSLRNSAQFLDLARQIGLGDVVRVVVNRANHGIRIKDISQTLKLPVAATVVSNGPKAVIAANEGTPVITKFPRDPLSTDLHNIARVVTRQAVPKERAAAKRWWMPFASRTSQA